MEDKENVTLKFYPLKIIQHKIEFQEISTSTVTLEQTASEKYLLNDV